MLDDILNIVNILKYFTRLKMISSLSIYVGLFGVGNIYAVNKFIVLETVTVSFGDQELLSYFAIFMNRNSTEKYGYDFILRPCNV